MQKTIFITISRGALARNILQTDVFDLLKKAGHRIVILTPAYRDERFLREFSAPNVNFENLVEPDWGWLDKFLVGWHKGLVYNDSTKRRDLYGIYNPKEGNIIKYFAKKIFFLPLSKISFLKEFFRWLDQVFIKDHYYDDIFKKYKPDLVFATSITEQSDVFVLKKAKEMRVKTIGMPKSWDNLSKISCRSKPDKMIVWSDYSKDEAIRFQNFKEKDIIICGIPQFDFYAGKNCQLTREEFCELINVDPKRKIIVFASEGRFTKYDGEVAEVIAEFINNKQLVQPAVLFIRPHFAYKDDEKKFLRASSMADVIIDGGYERSQSFRDRWDYSQKQIKRFTNIMRYADLIITTGSTISLDAAAFDKPIINVAFDGKHKLSFRESVARGYVCEYLKKLIATCGIWMTNSPEELLSAINGYLKNPSLLSEGRETIRVYFCYRIDGHSSRRIAEAVLNYAY